MRHRQVLNSFFMHTTITEKQIEKKDPAVRTLKIQRGMRYTVKKYIEVPEIKLRGTWLEKMGFCWDKHVDITCVDGVIIIRQRED